MELIQRDRESQRKSFESQANIQLRAADQVRKDHETHIKGVETAHGMVHADMDAKQNDQISAMQQELDELRAQIGIGKSATEPDGDAE